MFFSVGCDTQTLAVSTVANTPVTPPEEVLIDAGIVFADRASYLCLPFEKVGLPSDASVVSIESSCDCMAPSVVEYVDASGRLKKAVLLQFNEDGVAIASSEPLSEKTSAFLRLLVDIGLDTGSTRQFSISVLHANSINGGQ